MNNREPITIEGYTTDEILSAAGNQLRELALLGQPVVFKVGSATILAQFDLKIDSLIVELAHIDGGGEGILPTLWFLCEQYARQEGLKRIEWIVYATNCAQPNPKLKRVLDLRGFVIKDIADKGPAYYFLSEIL